jgi:hypothetical protein
MLRLVWRLIITPPSIRVGIVLNLLVFGITPAEGHLLAQNCGTFDVKKVAKIAEWNYENGLFAESYDTDGDGKVNVTTLSHPNRGKWGNDSHDAHPLFYLVDLDQDDYADQTWIDPIGEGKCSDIILYEDHNMPHEAGLNLEVEALNQGRDI